MNHLFLASLMGLQMTLASPRPVYAASPGPAFQFSQPRTAQALDRSALSDITHSISEAGPTTPSVRVLSLTLRGTEPGFNPASFSACHPGSICDNTNPDESVSTEKPLWLAQSGVEESSPKGILLRWVLPVSCTLAAGGGVYALYSIRGR